MKKVSIVFAMLFWVLQTFAQIQSPEKFLGYALGSRYTPHNDVLRYFDYVAAQATSTVVLKDYGETNEHRKLKMAFISSAENIKKLESIRANNLQLAGIGQPAPVVANTPVIVWLSYNVHGNETSSSEASMLTLYNLVNGQRKDIQQWLQNTVVVIDPCLNPDGRDRYINWFNSVVGKTPNAQLMAREHDEPWPGGRTNHYNFDLNRDWAWQTQVESQQRMAVYNQWMPQIHVDFHEQGINDPYYFAPAAQPFHEVITKFQRDFQVTIGKNHAKYFDQNNWLYFTGEVFDLLYPSYGDTYPIYNGSIGMTYEQAGGPAGGLKVINNDGDTLTLLDRIKHHFTTGMSTIEVASIHANELLKEYQQFFTTAKNGNVGTYKSYIIKNNPADKDKIQSLLHLLDKNGIEYGTSTGAGKGFSYQSNKETNFSVEKGDIVISAYQPKATLLKVLFEPKTQLVDSVTYDITAWALPYAYGLTSFATTQKFNVQPYQSVKINNTISSDVYGVVVKWQSLQSARLVAQLLQKGIRLKFAELPFTIGGEDFNSGSIIILKNGNEKFGANLWEEVASISNQVQVKIYPVQTGKVDKGNDFGSYYMHSMKPVNVVMLTGEQVQSAAAGEIWNFFDNELNYPITLVNAENFNRLKWNTIDVLILPDGRYDFFNDKQQSAKLQDWIKAGGRLVALENAVNQLSKQDWSILKSKKDEDEDSLNSSKVDYADLQRYDCRERESVTNGTPGAIFKVAIDNSHPLMFGYSNEYYTLKMDRKAYDFMKDGGWNVGVLKKEAPISGYVGYKLQPKLKDGLLFGVQDLGRGTITYLTDNVLFRNFWENGKLMFSNAVFMVGQ